MNTLLFEEKKCFYSTKIEECGKYQKKPFKLTKNLMESNSNVNPLLNYWRTISAIIS